MKLGRLVLWFLKRLNKKWRNLKVKMRIAVDLVNRFLIHAKVQSANPKSQSLSLDSSLRTWDLFGLSILKYFILLENQQSSVTFP